MEFRQLQGVPAGASINHLQDIVRIANNVQTAVNIAHPVTKELRDQALLGVNGVTTALNLHQDGAELPEILQHLKPGVDSITHAGRAILGLGKEVTNKLERASEDSPGLYSDVVNTELGVPNEHLDGFTELANKGY